MTRKEVSALKKRKKHIQSAVFAGMISLGMLGMLVSALTYMAKDYNYYNILYRFFNISREFGMTLTRQPVSQPMLLRCLNLSNVLFNLGFFLYALTFAPFFSRRVIRTLHGIGGCIAALQTVFLDPAVIVFLYMKRVLFWEDVFFYRTFYAVLTSFLRCSAALLGLFSFAVVLIAFIRTPRPMRLLVSMVLAIYSALLVTYLYLYRWMPVNVVWMSRVARLVTFQSLPIAKTYGIGRVLPDLSVALVVSLAAVTVYQMVVYSSEIRETKIFTRKISEADTVSRVFCHYIKNEVLAQQAELRLLETRAAPELQEDIQSIVARNEKMYAYLNEARQIFKQQKVSQEPLCLTALIREIVEEEKEKNRCEIQLVQPESGIDVLGNRYQLRSVFASLIKNAYEAPCGRNPLRLKIQTTLLHQYVRISIANNGQRIDARDRRRVFEPFYSTKPSTSNWGLGLALCKNIVILHHGKILVTEEMDRNETMTVFQVILPLYEA